MATRDPTVTVTQFTDPMCTWCWGSEPIRRHLRATYGDQLRFRFVVGGLIEDFETFSDAANDIAEPGDVGPHWLEASERHGMPVETAIFEDDPAASTYPASVAFAAARQQGRRLGHRYLRRLREAYATQVRNVNRREEQRRIAAAVGLDVDAFTTALDDGSAREAFEADLTRTRRGRRPPRGVGPRFRPAGYLHRPPRRVLGRTLTPRAVAGRGDGGRRRRRRRSRPVGRAPRRPRSEPDGGDTP